MNRPIPLPKPIHAPADRGGDAVERLLCIDTSAGAAAITRDAAGQILTAPLAALDPALLETARPDRVIFPLFGAGADAFAVIERLQALGYSGAITVLCPPLPRPKLVETELRAQGPGNRLTLLPLT